MTNKRGRKPWKPSQEHLGLITDLYSKGVPERVIAGTVGLSPSNFSSKKNEFPELQEALNKGLALKAQRIIEASDLLWERILGGSNGMLCFWLKCQADWSEDGAEKIAREVHSRVEQQREQIEREIGTKLRADADRQFSAMLDQFFNRCARELTQDEFDRIVDLFPTSIAWAEARSADQAETLEEQSDAECSEL